MILLGTINRWLRILGFVLVVEIPDSGGPEPIRLGFARASRWPLMPDEGQ